MADYKVSIELAAKVRDYVSGFESAIKVTDRLRSAQSGATASSAALAAELTAAGAAAKASAGDLRAHANAVRALERAEAKLADTRKAAPGSPSVPGGNPTDPLRNDPGRSRKTGEDTGKSFLDGLAEGVASRGGVAAVLGVGLAPLLGGVAAGAVVGGAGAAGVIGGLVLASKDPRVAQAGAALGHELTASLKADASGFVQPALAGIRTIRTGFHQIEPDLQRIFKGSARFVDPLVQGALKGAKSITTGVAEAVAHAGPVIDSFANAFERIGGAVGGAFSTLAPDAKTGALAINELTDATVSFVNASAGVVHVLALIKGGSDGSGGLQGIDRQFDKARSWIEDSSQLSDVLKHFGVNLDLTADGFKKNSAEGQAYRRMTLGVASAQDLQLLASKGVQEAADQVGSAQKDLAQTAGVASQKQQVLNASMAEAVGLAGDLAGALAILNGPATDFAQSQIAAERAVDKLQATLHDNGKALNKQGTDFDISTKKGQENKTAMLALAAAANDAADKRQKEGGSVAQVAAVHQKYVNILRASLAAQGIAPKLIDNMVSRYAGMTTELEKAAGASNSLNGHLKGLPRGHKFVFDGHTLIDANGHTLTLKGSLKGLPVGKTFHWNGKSVVDGTGKVYALKAAVDNVPKSKNIHLQANADQAIGVCRTLQGVMDGIHSKTVSINVTANTSSATAAEHRLQMAGRAKGGIGIPMAAGGIGDIYPASNPPLYRYAEPETGGEAFIPRKGDLGRGRMLVGEVASWYGMRATPMAAGGVAIPAAAGLVNVAPVGATQKATRLDYAEAYVQARDAVTSLNQSLKDNGRSFTFATSKGRENRSALYAVIRAAQDAAKTKFEETGSVRQADRAYDSYIARLKATLAQQKLNAAQVRSLLSVAGRPVYDTASVAPKNSLLNIGFAKSLIGARGSLADLQDALSLNGPTTNTGSKEGRDNLSTILGFLESASTAAQDRYAQTGSSKSATTLYNGFVTQLRQALTSNGYAKTAIDKLISEYGRITLVPNAAGGVYGAQAYGAGSTLYQFREPSTKGEAFIPRQGGTQASADRVLAIAAGWRGGQYIPQGATAGGSGGGHSSSLVVNNYGDRMTLSQFRANQRELDVKARVGRNN